MIADSGVAEQRREPRGIDQLHPPVPDLDQAGVLEVLEYTLHARALRTEHRGPLCLGDLDQSRAARGPQQVRGDLRLEATGDLGDLGDIGFVRAVSGER